MAQLDADQYVRLTPPITYGQDDGLFWDQTNSLLVLVIGDSVVFSVDSSGTILAGALEAPDLSISGQTRGDLLHRGASAWERLAAATSGQILVGDGTDLKSVAVSGDVTLSAAGAVTIAPGAVENSMLAGSITRANLLQQDDQVYPVPLEQMRVHDAPGSFLPSSSSADDMGLIAGTFGTSTPTLQGVDFGGTASDEKARFFFKLPPEYVSGQSVTVRCHAGMLTTIADGAATLDCEAYKGDGEGAVGSDLCTTAAIDINSLTLGDKDFTIDPTGLVAGDELDVRLSFAGSDTGDLGVMIPTITKISVLLDIKG